MRSSRSRERVDRGERPVMFGRSYHPGQIKGVDILQGRPGEILGEVVVLIRIKEIPQEILGVMLELEGRRAETVGSS